MNTPRRFASFLTCLILLTFCLADACFSQQIDNAFVRPIEGSRMVIGDGEVPGYTRDCFLFLCGNAAPGIVVIDLDGKTSIAKESWETRGADSVLVMSEIPKDVQKLTLQMLNADGVWIEGNPESIKNHPLLLALLKNITKRNGVIAVNSTAVSLLRELDENDSDRRLQSPFAKCEFHFGNQSPTATDNERDSHRKVHWTIPNSSVLVVHNGRDVAGYGDKDVSLLVKEANGLPKQEATFECPDVFGVGGYPSSSLDLLSWVRSASERGRSVFPPKVVQEPIVENGTLFLHGGARLHKDVLAEFVEIAGGKDVPYVCIPSAQQFGKFEEPRSYCAESLREMDCNNVEVLHTADPFVANQSKEFARILKNARGVWIDGGRTYRFMDSYEDTQVPELLAQVLERGGVVGGSSAGCQVPSDFLVRGNPNSNRDIEFVGYTRGMGLLKGVIIDAHFLQRERHEPFLGLMKKYPQMLGIGIDESTALIVKGHHGRVVGKAAVSFYDLKTDVDAEFKPVILKAGKKYDLKLRVAAD